METYTFAELELKCNDANAEKLHSSGLQKDGTVTADLGTSTDGFNAAAFVFDSVNGKVYLKKCTFFTFITSSISF